ncbi:MAG: TRL domain-containing protein [Planctomycetota bacterium]
MRRMVLLAALGAMAAWLGCAPWRAPVKPPRGLLFTHYSAPLTADAAGRVDAPAHGRSTVWYVREPFFTGRGVAWGEAAVRAAAEEGGVRNVEYADYEVLEILTVFGRFTVHAHGE